MKTYHYWQHTTSGEVYAVRLNEQGEAEAAYGPIHYTDYTRHTLPHFAYDEEDGLWIRSLAHEFRIIVPRTQERGEKI